MTPGLVGHVSGIGGGRMKASTTTNFLHGLLALGILAGSSANAAVDDPSQFHQNAVCVAAIEHELKDDVAAAESATDDLRRQWLARMEAGFAIIGQSYRQGLREPQATELLDRAREEVEAWAPPRRQAHAHACAERGERLLAQASALERYLLERAAQRRLARFLSRRPNA